MEKEYALAPKEHAEIHKRHVAEIVTQAPKSDKPVVIILAGQPGAGKSGLRGNAERHFAKNNMAEPVVVDIDELRLSHPEYRRFVAEDSRSASTKVQYDAGKWGRDLIEESRRQNKNIIIDGTLRSKENAEDLVSKFKKSGYEVEIHAIAVAREDSEMGVYYRHEYSKSRHKFDERWVPEDVREQAYNGMPQSIKHLEDSENSLAKPDRIAVFGRGRDDEGNPKRLYDSVDPVDGQSATASEAIDQERARKRTEYEIKDREIQQEQLIEMIKTRDPNLKESENKRAFEIIGRENDLHEHQQKMQNNPAYKNKYEKKSEQFLIKRNEARSNIRESRSANRSSQSPLSKEASRSDGHSRER